MTRDERRRAGMADLAGRIEGLRVAVAILSRCNLGSSTRGEDVVLEELRKLERVYADLNGGVALAGTPS